MTSGSLGLALLWVLTLATHCSARMRNYLPLSEVPSHEVIHITATRHASPGPAFNRLSARERLSALAGHPSEEELHPTFRLLSFTALGKQFDLELVKSHDLLSPDYKEYSVSDGSAEVYRTREQVTNCFYQGHVRALGERSESNWVTVSTCNGVQGYISGYGQLYRINPAAYHEQSYEHAEHHGEVTLASPHVILLAKHEVDFSQFPKTTHCGVQHTHEDGQHDHDHDHDHDDHSTHTQAMPGPRQSPQDEVRQAFTSLHSAGVSKEELSAINWNAYVAPPAANVDVCSKLPNTQESGLPRTLRAPFVPFNSAGPIFPSIAFVNDRPRVTSFGTFRLAGENAIGLANLANTYYANTPEFAAQNTAVKLSIVIQFFFTTDEIVTTPSGSEINYDDYLNAAETYFRNSPGGEVARTDFTIGSVLSGFDFKDTVVGLAQTDGACVGLPSAYQGIDIVQTTFCDAFNAATLAHEIGHNLGMCHDTQLDANGACSNSARVPPAATCPYYTANTQTDCTGSTSCLNKVMAAASNPDDPYVTFSHCSASDLLGAMTVNDINKGKDCLKVQRSAASSCGNGYVDGTEQCDCGKSRFSASDCMDSVIPAAYRDPCCDGNSCTLLPGKNCSAYQPCCDPNTCKPRTDTSVVCRAVKTCIKCDAEEKCDGVNANCPADILDPDCNGKSAILKWLEDHWIPLVFGILGGLALFFIVGCVRRKCCSSSDKAKPAAQRQSVAAASRASQAQQQQQSVPMSARGQSQSQPRPPPMNPAATGVVLPPNWVVQYTENGQPVYINTITGERYDFAQQQSGGF